jgi:hypothetical protein
MDWQMRQIGLVSQWNMPPTDYSLSAPRSGVARATELANSRNIRPKAARAAGFAQRSRTRHPKSNRNENIRVKPK